MAHDRIEPKIFPIFQHGINTAYVCKGKPVSWSGQERQTADQIFIG